MSPRAERPAPDTQRRSRARRAGLVGTLWRWHRRTGLAAALFLVFMALSGILLNHGAALGLERPVPALDWLRRVYGEPPTTWTGYAAGSHWVSQRNEGRFHLDAQPAERCDGRLVGALWSGDLLLVACERELVLLQQDGARVDSMNAASGLPGPLEAVAADPDGVLLRLGSGWRRFDPLEMAFGTPVPMAEGVPAAEPPRDLREALDAGAGWLSWERLLLDLHSGRLFGPLGPLVVDAIGLLAIALALSGVTMWSLHRRH